MTGGFDRLIKRGYWSTIDLSKLEFNQLQELFRNKVLFFTWKDQLYEITIPWDMPLHILKDEHVKVRKIPTKESE